MWIFPFLIITAALRLPPPWFFLRFYFWLWVDLPQGACGTYRGVALGGGHPLSTFFSRWCPFVIDIPLLSVDAIFCRLPQGVLLLVDVLL